MEDEDRKNLYITLLNGLGKTAQDQLCAADKQHVWSDWRRTRLHHDRPLRFCGPEGMAAEMNEVVRARDDRQCLNCGKKEMAKQ